MCAEPPATAATTARLLRTPDMWMLPSCLLAVIGFAVVLRKPRMFGTAAVLLANWVVNTGVVSWTGESYPWAWFLCTDYLSGMVLLMVAGKPTLWQVLIAALFALECIAHGIFGAKGRTAWTEYYYWYTLHYVAWSQLWAVTSWGLYEVAGRGLRHVRGAPPSVAGMVRDRPAAWPEP